MRTLLIPFVMFALAACGGGSNKKADTTPPPPAPAPTPATDPAPAPTAAGEKLTEAECRGLMEHMFEVMDREATPEQKEQLEQVKPQAMEEGVPQCIDSVTRAQYDCAMKAQSTAELQKCG